MHPYRFSVSWRLDGASTALYGNITVNCTVSLASEIAKVMKMTGRTRRMDSMMIDVNIKKLSRLELIYTCIANLVKRLSKEGNLEIPEELKHYAAPNDFNCKMACATYIWPKQKEQLKAS